MTNSYHAPVRLVRVGQAKDANGEPLNLTYDLRPCEAGQARFQGRLRALPRLSLSDYIIRACVDWIELKFETRAESQNRHVSDALRQFSPRPPHVTDWLGREGFAAGTHRKFVVRLQEPDARVLDIARRIDARWGLTGRVQVNAIEISIDVFPRDASDEKRWLMTTLLTRSYMPLRDLMDDSAHRGRFVFSDAAGSKRTTLMVQVGHSVQHFTKCPANHNAPPADATTYFGEKDGPAMTSIQDKLTDQRQKASVVHLAQEQKRTRVEVTLRGKGLEAVGLTSLKGFKGNGGVFTFRGLRAPFFCFGLPTFDPADERYTERLEIASKTGVYGLERGDLRHRDVHRSATGANAMFSELNERLRLALHRLDDRWTPRDGEAA